MSVAAPIDRAQLRLVAVALADLNAGQRWAPIAGLRRRAWPVLGYVALFLASVAAGVAIAGLVGEPL